MENKKQQFSDYFKSYKCKLRLRIVSHIEENVDFIHERLDEEELSSRDIIDKLIDAGLINRKRLLAYLDYEYPNYIDAGIENFKEQETLSTPLSDPAAMTDYLNGDYED